MTSGVLLPPPLGSWLSFGAPFALLRYCKDGKHDRKDSRNDPHERNRVSVNTLREWLGHESLDVTFACLKGSPHASTPPTKYNWWLAIRCP